MEREVVELFHIFDKDGNGFIDKSELIKTYLELGHEMDVTRAEQMIAQVDFDGDK